MGTDQDQNVKKTTISLVASCNDGFQLHNSRDHPFRLRGLQTTLRHVSNLSTISGCDGQNLADRINATVINVLFAVTENYLPWDLSKVTISYEWCSLSDTQSKMPQNYHFPSLMVSSEMLLSYFHHRLSAWRWAYTPRLNVRSSETNVNQFLNARAPQQ